jgi:hypothetical protein
MRNPTIVLTLAEKQKIWRNFPSLPITVEEWSKRFDATKEEIDEMANVPQGTELWKKYRMYRLTGSVYGSAVGENKYNSPNDLCREMLWEKEMDERGKANCLWGNQNEDNACDAYEEYMRTLKGLHGDKTRFWVEHFGLEVHPEEMWSGDSKDGLVCNELPDGTIQKWLLEIKCPPRKQFGPDKGRFVLYPEIPSYYYAQIQGIMGYNKLPFCDFVIWNPEKMSIERYMFDPEYYQWLRTNMREWYVTEFAPRAILKEHNMLRPNEIDIVQEISFEDSSWAQILGPEIMQHMTSQQKPPQQKPPTTLENFFTM